MESRHNILVTGGAGFIGSHTANRLARIGHCVVAYDDLSTGFKDSLDKNVELVLGDVRDKNQLKATFLKHKIDAVIHCAAKISVEESVSDPTTYFDVNTNGTAVLLQSCSEAGILKMVFSSTAAVYGETEDKKVSEQDPCIPINPYGKSKLEAETLIRSNDFGLSWLILRYFNVVGAASDGSNGQRYSSNALFPVAARSVLFPERTFTVNGNDYNTKDGSCIRDYIHVEDLVSAHILALDYLINGGVSAVLNCGYGKGYSVFEVLDMMSKISGRSIDLKIGPRRPLDPSAVIADNTKILNLLKWKPKFVDLNLLCDSTLNWQRILLNENS